jgi:hypothetical protein
MYSTTTFWALPGLNFEGETKVRAGWARGLAAAEERLPRRGRRLIVDRMARDVSLRGVANRNCHVCRRKDGGYIYSRRTSQLPPARLDRTSNTTAG